MNRTIQLVIAVINIVAGPYFAYHGWRQGEVYIPTQFFIGSSMFCFGVALLFVLARGKR